MTTRTMARTSQFGGRASLNAKPMEALNGR
jgi:hypothetical protein